MKTPVIIALTALGSISVFSAGGVIATQFYIKATQAAAPSYEAQVSRSVMTLGSTDIAAAEQIIAPEATIAPAPVVAAAPAVVEVAAPAAQNTSDILQNIIAASEEVVLYDFVSASQSATQFENAIPDQMATSVVNALRAGESAQEVEKMIGAASELGLINVPAALSTPDGQADSRAILLAITAEHEAATGETFQLDTVKETVAIETPTRNQLYVVEPGDSLAYISLIFYGSTEDYRVIFNANRSKIESPDRISVGQRLIIPAI